MRTLSRFSRRAVSLAILTVVLLIGNYQSAYATDFRGGQIVVVGPDEVIEDDLFISGERVEVNGTVQGNLFASGTEITVNGHVQGSLFMAGRTLIANGVTDGSIYAGGYAFAVGPEASVGRNLNFGGFSLTTEPGSEIGRSLYAGGYQMILGGDVTHDVSIGAAALELAGSVGGDVMGGVANPEQNTDGFFMPQFEGSVPAIDPGLRVSEQANIGGDLKVDIAAPEETVVAPPLLSVANPLWRWVAGEYIALLLVGALLLAFWPALLNRTSNATQESWLPSAGVGLLGLILFAIAVPLTLVLVILLAVLGGWLSFGHLVPNILGLGIGTLIFAVAVFIFTAAMLAKIIVAYTGGRLCLRWMTRSTESDNMTRFFALLIGLLIYILLRAIPFGIGGVFGFIVTLIGLGAIFFTLRGERQSEPAPAMPAVGTPGEVPA